MPKHDQILIWSGLTKQFHPTCFMARTGAYLVGKTEEVEPCLCIPSCTCQFEEDFAAGLRAGLDDMGFVSSDKLN